MLLLSNIVQFRAVPRYNTQADVEGFQNAFLVSSAAVLTLTALLYVLFKWINGPLKSPWIMHCYNKSNQTGTTASRCLSGVIDPISDPFCYIVWCFSIVDGCELSVLVQTIPCFGSLQCDHFALMFSFTSRLHLRATGSQALHLLTGTTPRVGAWAFCRIGIIRHCD